MAQHVEPMDIDSSVCDFDDKENAFHHNNAHPRTPCTEKGYEELDVSELNMKLRYSVTPAVSPMSKSYAGNFENRNYEFDNTIDGLNGNMTRSLHTTLTKNDSFNKTQKTLPLQNLPTDGQFGDGNRNILQPLESTLIVDKNITETVSATNDDENMSLPSSSSSIAHTPEATTPTKEIPKIDGGSPIIRGLKSVLNMFRPSQSPIPGEEGEDLAKLETLSPPIVHSPDTSQDTDHQAVTASTPLVGHKTRDPIKRNSPNRDSIVFNEDLETDLEWKDDSTIIFSNEKIPIHKLFFHQAKSSEQKKTLDMTKTINNELEKQVEDANVTLEYMDISYNNSVMDKTATKSDFNKSEATNVESDNEFVDCESNFSKNESFKSQDGNELNSTEDVLSHINDIIVEATNLNVSLETLNASDAKSANLSTASTDTTKAFNISNEPHFGKETTKDNKSMQVAVVPEELKKEDQMQDIEAKDETKSEKLRLLDSNEISPAVSDEININLNTACVIDPVLNDVTKSNLLIKNNDTNFDNVQPDLDNLGVKSIYQIPLIVDPRVLLFNIPIETDKKNEETEKDQNTSPADIPLPEDDDIPSLPVMNSELETLSNTLDKIAEEIPKINQHENSVSSVDLSDNKSVENLISSEVRETSVSEMLEIQVDGSEDLESHDVDALKVEDSEVLAKHNYVTGVESFEVNNTLSAVVPITTELQTKIENVVLSAEKSKYIINEPDTEAEIEISIQSYPEIAENINVPIQIQKEPEATDINSVAETILQKEIEQKVETMDISVTEVQVTADANQPQVTSGEVANVNASNLKLESQTSSSENIYPKNIVLTEIDEVERKDRIETLVQANQCIIPDGDLSKVSKTTEVRFEKSNTQMIESDIDFIKQEVEEIVSKAIDIAIEKTNAQTNNIIEETPITFENNIQNKNTILESIDTNLLNVTMENNIKQDVIESFEHIQGNTDPIKHESTDTLHTSTMTSNEDANVQQMLLNLISDNKYNYTVQDNIPTIAKENNLVENHNVISANLTTEDTRKTDSEKTFAESDQTDSKLKTPVIPNDVTMDVYPINNVVTCTEAAEEINIDFQSAAITKKDNVIDDTPLDVEKIEPAAAKGSDYEVKLSENNSPFVLVQHERLHASVENPNENFEDVENPFAITSKIVKTPPSSPKIVSKGYNFNFDEIDDPFATKTKIRVSPALDASPNHTCEQINIDQEPPKKEVSKNNRRKSQPDRRRSAVNNKKLNSTFGGKSGNEVKSKVTEAEFVSPLTTSDKSKPADLKLPNESAKDAQLLDKTNYNIMDVSMNGENILAAESIAKNSNENKGTSSSEQSAYFSAGTSSDEVIESKTEIDDPHFNPFATKSKIRQSPPPEIVSPFVTRSRICQTPPQSLDDEDSFVTKSKIRASPETSLILEVNKNPNFCLNANSETQIQKQPIDVNENSACNITVNIESTQNVISIDKSNAKIDYSEEKESSENISGTTCSLNNDKDTATQEVNTEDEDTVEGPFLEAEDLQNDDKISDFDGENADMMQFSELPPENDENPDAGELFIDAEAFEFLLNQNKANTVTDSGKESLFLKFDPLFAKRVSSDGVMAALKQVQTRAKQSTPVKDKKPPIPRDATFDKSSIAKLIPRDATFDKPCPTRPISRDSTFDKSSPAGPSGLNTTQEMYLNSSAEESYDDLNVTVSKPMMVVNPAVNPVVTPRNKTITPVRSNRQSLTFTSPAIAVIDRLLSMSAGNNSLMALDSTVAEVHRDNEALALTQLRELLADKEINVYSLRSESKELQNRLATMESQMKSLESISEDRLKKINELNEKLNEKTNMNKSMAKVVEEYERTIASLIAEMEQDKKNHAEEKLQLIKERDEQTAHLASMEVSFSDLHSKYEKSKQVILGFKANEDAYKKSIKEFEENLAKTQNNYELLKQHATSKLNHANEELQKINRAHEAEVLKMNAMIKRKELHITSLEETLQQKTKANEELTAICDELINKVG